MQQHDPLQVFVVDDDPDTRANLRDILEMDGHIVLEAGSAAELWAKASSIKADAILLDRHLPDATGESLLPRLRESLPEAAILIVTGYFDLDGAVAALRQGAVDYILKPISPEALRASLHRVADRSRLTRAKEQSEAAFRALVEAAPCLIAILGQDQVITYISPFAEELTGHPAETLIGRDFAASLIPPPERSTASAALDAVSGGKPLRAFETQVVRVDGTTLWVLWNAQVLPGSSEGASVLAVGQDITAMKRAQERVVQAERLAAIGQMVTGLAHESGNALARSQACLEMLALEVQDRPEALGLVGRVQKAQDHLQHLYEEVRNYAAPLALQREPCSLDGVWRMAWSSLGYRREGRDAELKEPSGGSTRCVADPFRMEQVFRNIFENSLAACKGRVEVCIGCADSVLDGQPALKVMIQDNGPGLGPEQRARIFEPFYTTKTRGTGLGMAIAKRIVEAHGGRISLGPSLPPAGAEIVIELPREGTP
jgi:PAS domain S-box-containing protein